MRVRIRTTGRARQGRSAWRRFDLLGRIGRIPGQLDREALATPFDEHGWNGRSLRIGNGRAGIERVRKLTYAAITLSRIAKAAFVPLSIMIVVNIENAGNFLGGGDQLKRVFATAPVWGPKLYENVTQPWLFALLSFVMGLIVADWAIRYDERIHGRYGRVPKLWFMGNLIITRLAIRYPHGFGRVVDQARALRKLNDLLIRADFRFPALPSVDPLDGPGMVRTRKYLDVLGWRPLWNIDQARTLAESVTPRPTP